MEMEPFTNLELGAACLTGLLGLHTHDAAVRQKMQKKSPAKEPKGLKIYKNKAKTIKFSS